MTKLLPLISFIIAVLMVADPQTNQLPYRNPSHANKWLLQKVLRDEWVFNGVVVAADLVVRQLHVGARFERAFARGGSPGVRRRCC